MTPRTAKAVTGRRLRWLLPALLVLGWLVVAGVTGSFQAKLGDVVTNDGKAYLPSHAEAVQANDLQERFTNNNTYPAIVVYERTSGVTAADRAAAEADAAAAARLPHLTGPVSPVKESTDGKALQFTVPVENKTTSVHDTVAALRTQAQGHAGLVAHVTGLAGLFSDLGTAFTSIDGTLLLVAVGLVVLVLLLVYRSPLLPFLVLIAAVFAMGLAAAVVYALTKAGAITLTGQSQGVLLVLVVGATTDYALLLVSRYQEELRRTSDKYDALTTAWRAVLWPVLASGGTVILGTLCLMLSGLNSNRSMGPVAALGIAAALLAGLTFLPAVLALTGRGTFWPFRPRYGSAGERAGAGLWGRLTRMVDGRQRVIWVAGLLLMVVASAFATQYKASGLALAQGFTTTNDSVAGQDVLAAHYLGGTGVPVTVIAKADSVAQVEEAERTVEGLTNVTSRPPVDGLAEVDSVLTVTPDSPAGDRTVRRLREAVHALPGADAKVGGYTAVALDTRNAGDHDLLVIIPAVLAVILVILALLLRSVVAPLVLIGTVVLSFGATMGVAALVFNHALGFAGSEPWVPLLGFVFLVAFGVDYNIFLMHRVREESLRLGTRAGTLKALRATGGVITSAGVVLAATFAALSVVPMVSMAEQAFIVAFGVLLDTLLVRSLVVPALTLQLDRWIWWPSRLAFRPAVNEPGPTPELVDESEGGGPNRFLVD